MPPVEIPMREKPILASKWLDQNRAVQQMVWAPGEPTVIESRLMADGGWVHHIGAKAFNLYRPPQALMPPPAGVDALPWVRHVEYVFGEEADHIIRWLAHRVQRPHEKVNHALVLGGAQGIGKDTLLEPVKAAVGGWNFAEVSPQQVLGRFNGFLKSVILRISEARDLGEADRYAFYDHMKAYTAAPPDVLRVDEKYLREHSILNVCGIIITPSRLSSRNVLQHLLRDVTCKNHKFCSIFIALISRLFQPAKVGCKSQGLSHGDLRIRASFDGRADCVGTGGRA
ncbi:hypothetical protein KIP88_39110 [Bradyrhizobium sp. SRL28]|uniref:primase-helicase family protein n=1 Tax=Bradyrhizobium sp. SRL28 TaxID=2836178 RepID=UPI001BDEBF6F|nr:primase-helicase family protein [Bradyrhizobium sp. SRL28]MBT1516448.1 hypothetical protein [Bradyrhizobium sp. SRL28]